MASRTAIVLAALIALSRAAIVAPVPAVTPPRAEALLARYQAAILSVKQPPNMVVEYTQTRSGPIRVVTENHRLYRDAAGHERNETMAVNGTPITPARVSIYTRPAWAYSVDKFAVDPAVYQVAPRGPVDVDGRKGYSYAVVMKDAGAFAVTDLELDARTAMPLRERFVATSATCSSTGTIDFGPSSAYWLPKIVSVTCPLPVSPDAAVITPAAAVYRDTIRFSSYSFPAAIPAQVFGLPPTPAPGMTGAGQP